MTGFAQEIILQCPSWMMKSNKACNINRKCNILGHMYGDYKYYKPYKGNPHLGYPHLG